MERLKRGAGEEENFRDAAAQLKLWSSSGRVSLQVDELCAPGKVRLAATRRCVVPERHDCAPACGPVGGELHAQLGM